MRAIRPILLLFIAFLGIAAANAGQPLEALLAGKWRGETTLGTREIAFEASFSNDGQWTGTMQLLGINSRPLELQDIILEGDAVTFRLPATSRSSGETSPGTTAPGEGRRMATGNGFHFSGRLEESDIVGTMAVGPMSSAMKMRRED